MFNRGSDDTKGVYSQIGGLSNSVIKLAEGQGSNEHLVGVITTRKSSEPETKKFYWGSIYKYSILELFIKNPLDEIEKSFFKPDILHAHDIYEIKQIPIILHALRRGYKVYISPRGTLSPVALSRKKFKKIFFITFILNYLIFRIEGFVALNRGEKKHILQKYPKKKVAIISNGCDDNKFNYKKFKKNYDEKLTNNLINIGFMGRYEIHIKGLDLLLNALTQYQKKADPKKLKLTLLGNHINKEYDSETYIRKIKNSLKDDSMLDLIGPLYNEDKWAEISKFDVFIHPSRTEGMPNAVLEAMSMGIPCSISPQTNMGEIINEANCGWVFENNIESITNHLIKLSAMDKSYLIEKGINGMNYANTNLSWAKIGKQKYE